MFITLKIEDSDMYLLAMKIHRLLETGLRIESVLTICHKESYHPGIKRVLRTCLKGLNEGRDVHRCLEKCEVFPEIVIYLVASGEMRGDITQAFADVANFYKLSYEKAGKIKESLVLAKLLLFCTLVLAIFLTKEVLPIYLFQLEDLKMTPPKETLLLLQVESFVSLYYPLIGFVALCSWLTVKLIMATNRAKFIRDAIVFSLFKTTRMVTNARFADTLKVLLHAKVPLDKAIGVSGNCSGNLYLKKASYQMVKLIHNGQSISSVVNNARCFDLSFKSMVCAGDELGEFASMMHEIASYYKEESKQAFHTLSRCIYTFSIVSLALPLSWIIKAIAYPSIMIMTGYMV